MIERLRYSHTSRKMTPGHPKWPIGGCIGSVPDAIGNDLGFPHGASVGNEFVSFGKPGGECIPVTHAPSGVLGTVF
jgi:hypothetical protein